MISNEIPLPIPYSSICSPSHIRNIEPAVMIATEVICQPSDKLLELVPKNWDDAGES